MRQGFGDAGPPTFGPVHSGTLVCFSHLRWNFVYQRPQHLLSRAASTYRVIYFEEPVHADRGVLPRLDLNRLDCGVTVATPVLEFGTPENEAVAAQRAMVDELTATAEQPLVLWYYTPMAGRFTAHLRPGLCVFDCMDDLSGFLGAPKEMALREAELIRRADLVFTGGVSLYEAKRRSHPRMRAFPSSIDKAHFGRARMPLRPPEDQAWLPQPRVGFFGVIDERMDLRLVRELAELRSDWQFVMVGPVAKIDRRDLPQAPNLHWLGPKDYGELPAYLAGWNAGFMPFARNRATRFISPTKTPEFLAAGVPVASTPITDVVRPWGNAGLVEVAEDAPSMAEALEGLIMKPRPPWLEKVDKTLAGQSWDRTWFEMHAMMAQALRSKPSRAHLVSKAQRERQANSARV